MALPFTVESVQALPEPPWPTFHPIGGQQVLLEDGKNIAVLDKSKSRLRRTSEAISILRGAVSFVSEDLCHGELLLGAIRSGHIFAWNTRSQELLLIEGLENFATSRGGDEKGAEEAAPSLLRKFLCPPKKIDHDSEPKERLAIRSICFSPETRRLLLVLGDSLYSWSYTYSRRLDDKGKDKNRAW